MSDKPGSPPPGQRFKVGADGRAVLIPDVLGPEGRINVPSYAQWRSAILQRVGDGGELYDILMSLARGEAQVVCYPDDYPVEALRGQPVQKPVYFNGLRMGYEEVVVPVPPAVRRAAASELLDRAFGKPVQVVADLTPPSRDAYAPPGDLPESKRALLLALARERMLGERPEREREEEQG